jgi:hypothetical protein
MCLEYADLTAVSGKGEAGHFPEVNALALVLFRSCEFNSVSARLIHPHSRFVQGTNFKLHHRHLNKSYVA